ncbi:MAG: GNAT family N-acetyltransferase [Saprospiraceae bacterium]
MNIEIKETKDVLPTDILSIYSANHWSSANKPDQLYRALLHSHSFITAWDHDKLVGLGNALSDGHLVVYYPHLIVHPYYQRRGVGKMIMDRLQQKYKGLHQQILVADGKSIEFYKKFGFKMAGDTKSMWIYDGDDH